MPRLIITDVDGTLVKDGTLSINSEYFAAMKALCGVSKKRCGTDEKNRISISDRSCGHCAA